MVGIAEILDYRIQFAWTDLVNALASIKAMIDETPVQETLDAFLIESLFLHEIVFDRIHPHDGRRNQHARMLREQPTIEVTTAVAYLEIPTCHRRESQPHLQIGDLMATQRGLLWSTQRDKNL